MFGIELSLKSVDFARNNFQLLTVIPGSADEIDSKFEDSSFDVITAFDVVEHLANPQEVLAKIRRKLKPDGLLVISVPLIDSFAARWFGKRWHALVPSHLNYFSRKSLKNFYESLGYGFDYERFYTRYLSLENILRRLLKRSGFSIPKFLNISVPVNLFDEAELYLRKI